MITVLSYMYNLGIVIEYCCQKRIQNLIVFLLLSHSNLKVNSVYKIFIICLHKCHINPNLTMELMMRSRSKERKIGLL